MRTNAHNDPKDWEQQIALLHASINDFETRFEAELHTMRCGVDDLIEEMHAAVRQLEAEVAAVRPDTYVHRIAAQVAELKLKGDAAYELLQERLRPHTDAPNTTEPFNEEHG